MLTLGAEYSSWSRTDKSNTPGQRRTATVGSTEDDSLDGSDVGTDEPTYYDTIHELEGSFHNKNVPNIIDAHEAFSEDIR